MNDKWKGFWRGVAVALGTIATAGLYLVLRRGRNGASPTGTVVDDPSHVASDTARAVEQARAEIKADTDDALAARFNALAAKQKRKDDE